ncbi:MAG: peptidylprolyl isomerase [Planctomycetota bacterium]
MPLHPARLRCWKSSWSWNGWTPIWVGLFVALFAFAPRANAQQPPQQSSIVAVVNADPITRKQLAQASIDRYGKEVLDNMVNRHLILQECNKRGIAVTKEEVSGEIRRLADKFGLTLESYLQLLQEERDISPNQYSREVIWPMLSLRKLVANQVQVSDKEFNEAFLSEYGEAVKCRLIMIEKRSDADSVHQKAVANPSNFGQLAKEESEDASSASVGGLIPPIRRYSGDSRLEQAAFALKNGEVSPVLQLGNQWIILQAVRRIPAHTPPPQAMPAIREQITDRIRDQKVRTSASELFQRLQTESKVVQVLGDEDLSRQYPGAAAVINGEQINLGLVGEECIKRHGIEVLETEIHRRLLTQALRTQRQQVTEADLNSEIATAAVGYGYVKEDGTADIDGWMESVLGGGTMTREVYLADAVWPSAALRKLVKDQVKLTEEDLKSGFESAYGPRVEVLAIVLSDQRSAEEVWTMARDNPTENFFGQLAEQYSVEPVSSSNRGKVPPIRKHSGQPAIEREAFALKPGQRSGIISTGGKYIILYCQGFTEPVVQDASVVRQELIRDLTESKMNQAMVKKFDELKDNAEIDNFLEVPKVASSR